MPDLSQLRLGKAPARRDRRTLRLAKYLTRELPPTPKKRAWHDRAGEPWPMLLNDRIGCCTIATALHMRRAWNANAGRKFEPTEAQVLEGYRRIAGYDPRNPASDQGAVALDVLNAWRKDGIAGERFLAFVSVTIQDREEVKAAIEIFGGVYCGVMLPLSAQKQKVWKVVTGHTGRIGTWGGHMLYLCGYDQYYVTFITWGKVQRATWAWLQKYSDEAYAVLSRDWLNHFEQSPQGFDVLKLQKDLQLLTADD